MPTEIAVAPALGHALMATQGGIGSTPGYDAIDLRRMIQGLHGTRPGVLDVGGWKVSERAVAPAMSVDVAAQIGLARVNGGSVAAQGGYVIAPHATMITLDVPASNATNPRIDSVYLVVRDNAHDGSGFTDARVVLLAGTATAGATLNNRTGAAVAPTSSVRLADVLVAANASSVANGVIQSRRPLIVPGREVGDTFFWPASSNPPGCTILSGGTRNRLVFSELFALLGTTFGAGDGSTTFNVPNAYDRSLVGSGGTKAFGASGGAETHTLSEAQLAAHTHSVNDPGHSHAPGGGGTDKQFLVAKESEGAMNLAVGTTYSTLRPNYSPTTTGTSTSGVSLASKGSGLSHNNMPPYLALLPVMFTGADF